jgi:hypothetical protein
MADGAGQHAACASHGRGIAVFELVNSLGPRITLFVS